MQTNADITKETALFDDNADVRILDRYQVNFYIN